VLDGLHEDLNRFASHCRAALVTIALCNTLVMPCSRQLTGPVEWAFVVYFIHAPLKLRLEAVVYGWFVKV